MTGAICDEHPAEPAGRCRRPPRRFATVVVVAIALLACAVTEAPAGASNPQDDPFYQYTGTQPLGTIAPGTVLKTRTVWYSVAGVPTPVRAVQLLYRSTGVLAEPTVNVTSVLLPPVRLGRPKVISYQSYYDSLDPADQPSAAIAGNVTMGGFIPTFESTFMAPMLLAGNTIVIPDTEGQDAAFLAGPLYGYNTLDSLRAALNSPATGLANSNTIGLFGYSGGAIASEWAAELAPTYAPDINARLAGVAVGGVVVHLDHALNYVSGSGTWAGLLVPALIGISRAYDVDLDPYLNAYGRQLVADLQHASLPIDGGSYAGLTWSDIAAPEYPTLESAPDIKMMLNELIMGTDGTPTVPFFVGQGAAGQLEGTPTEPGAGDGVALTGDVRTLMRNYCQSGVPVQYNEYPLLSHNSAGVQFIAEGVTWMVGRLAGVTPPQNCAQIAPGTPIDPIP